MAFKVVWSESALEDLRDIVSFIAADNPPIAESFGYLLVSKVDLVERFPQLGRVVPGAGDLTIREIVFRSYRIIYRLDEANQSISIARVWHGARGEPEIPLTND